MRSVGCLDVGRRVNRVDYLSTRSLFTNNDVRSL